MDFCQNKNWSKMSQLAWADYFCINFIYLSLWFDPKFSYQPSHSKSKNKMKNHSRILITYPISIHNSIKNMPMKLCLYKCIRNCSFFLGWDGNITSLLGSTWPSFKYTSAIRHRCHKLGISKQLIYVRTYKIFSPGDISGCLCIFCFLSGK